MTERMRRVNEAIRETLAEAIGELKDPRIGFVTVTGVETSPDLRHAKVFVSVLGNERKREKTLLGLESAHGVLQLRLATRAQDEADSAPDLRIRSHGRGRRPHVAVDRRAGSGGPK